MNITDLFIRRPVLASVISLIILVLGLRSMFSLPVRQFPTTQNASVTITTAYFGANPDVIAGFITTPLERAVSQAEGIDYISSRSISGVSTITAVLRLNYDSSKALTEINTKVNSVKNQLPAAAQQPQIQVSTAQKTASMYISFNSSALAPNQITDYLIRVVQPKLQSLPGVQSAEILGGRRFALRAWLNPQKLTAMGLNAQDVYSAISSNHYVSATGSSKGQMVTINLKADTDLHSLEAFRKLVVKRSGSHLVRLEDVANVTLGAENYNSNVLFDGKKSVYIGIRAAPDANLLDVINGVRESFPGIQAQLPTSLDSRIVYDATKFVNSSIREVLKTLAEALIIVTLVIFLFLGSVRSVLIPLITIPLSLIGTFFIMLFLGYTINLLTLLALVLAIGLVVDDAIIMVENIDRYIQQGKSRLDAALLGAKELAMPIIAISVVLIAVYIPIGFQGGLTGVLFSEFAFTLAAAVGVSTIIALTLSPVMCEKLLSPQKGAFAHRVDHFFEKLRAVYNHYLEGALGAWPVMVCLGFIVIGLSFIFAQMSKKELAPPEDQGAAFLISSGPPSATIDQMKLYSKQVLDITKDMPEREHLVQFDGFQSLNSGFSVFVATPWDQRDRKMPEIISTLQPSLNNIAGVKTAVFSPPPLPGGGEGLPFQLVIKTTDSFNNLSEVATDIMQAGLKTGKFFFMDNDLKLDKPQASIKIDHEKAAAMGFSMRDIGQELGAMLGGGYVNYFSMAGRSYKVIPQVQRHERLNPQQLKNYHIRTPKGKMIPLSTLISFESETVPQSINHFQQLNSATISGVSGEPMGDLIKTMQEIALDILPGGYFIDFAGESRQAVQESGGFALTLSFSILIIFLVLAAQFESFRDPLIIMVSVPMAIFGAMIFIFEDMASLNIYTEVGIVTLVGLIAKHGILIVKFANDEQLSGKSKLEAIKNAANVRLRPILMTTAATALGVLPLVLASGAGAIGRNNMGLVIMSGISIGTLFTLFIIPAVYLWLATEHNKARNEVITH